MMLMYAGNDEKPRGKYACMTMAELQHNII